MRRKIRVRPASDSRFVTDQLLSLAKDFSGFLWVRHPKALPDVDSRPDVEMLGEASSVGASRAR